MRRSLFDLSAPAAWIWPKPFREALHVRSPRTIDNWRTKPGFPQGRLENFGGIQVRVWTASELGQAQVWCALHHLPGRRAGHPRIANLEKARTARAEERDLLQLAGRLLRVLGPQALADALRPLGFHVCGFEKIPKNSRSLVRVALVRALEVHGVQHRP